MKKQGLLALLLALLVLASLSPAVFAQSERVSYVYDLAETLTAEDADALQARAAEIAERHRFAPYIIIVQSTEDYTQETEINAAAKDIYEYNDFGYAPEKAGSLALYRLSDNAFGYYSVGATEEFFTAEQQRTLLTELLKPEMNADAWTAYLAMTDSVLSGGESRELTEAPEVTVAPAIQPPVEESTGSGRFVYDAVGLLTAEEAASLQTTAEEIDRDYNFGVYTVIVQDYRTETGKSRIEDAAEEIYKALDLGRTEKRDGIMLLLSMAGRDYDLCAYGYGHYVFTDYGKDWLADRFKDDFRYNNWIEGLRDYLVNSQQLLQRANAGDPLDVPEGQSGTRSGGRRSLGTCIIVGLVVGLIVALIVTSIQKKKLISVRKAAGAAGYTVPNSLNLTGATDQFTHVTESRVRIESDSRSGGGGTSISSGGFSHSSGKF